MAVKTGEQYLEELKETKPNVYMHGERVEDIWNDPRFESTKKIMAINHGFAFEDAHKEIAIVQSPQVDEPVRRITNHIQTTMEDSLLKLDLTRDIANRRICAWCGTNTMSLV